MFVVLFTRTPLTDNPTKLATIRLIKLITIERWTFVKRIKKRNFRFLWNRIIKERGQIVGVVVNFIKCLKWIAYYMFCVCNWQVAKTSKKRLAYKQLNFYWVLQNTQSIHSVMEISVSLKKYFEPFENVFWTFWKNKQLKIDIFVSFSKIVINFLKILTTHKYLSKNWIFI